MRILIERGREGEIEEEIEMERKIHTTTLMAIDQQSAALIGRPINGRALNLMARHSQAFSLPNNSEIISFRFCPLSFGTDLTGDPLRHLLFGLFDCPSRCLLLDFCGQVLLLDTYR